MSKKYLYGGLIVLAAIGACWYFSNKDEGNIEDAALALTGEPVPLELGKKVSFAVNGNSIKYIVSGFFDQEQDGSWTNGKEAVMKMLTGDARGKALSLKATAMPYLGKSLKEQVVTVLANDTEIANWNVAQQDVYSAEIPASITTADDLTLVFKISNPMSPASEGLSEDDRNLGIMLNDMLISEDAGFEKIKLDEKMSFLSEGNSTKYVVSGFSVQEQDGTWTDGKEAVMKMQVKGGKNENLLLKATVSPYLGKSLKEQVVTVLANDKEIAQWSVAQQDVYSAEIPASIMTTDDLKLVFKISDPLLPASESLSEDERNLGIMFNDMVISEK